MADDTANTSTREDSNDVKQSFAWGQLFAGSIIGGLAVWKLLHKMTNTEPSEWFRGLSAAFDEWRDWLMTPFHWLNLHLSATEQNAIVICMVLGGALARTIYRFPRAIASIVYVVVATAIGVYSGAYLTDWTNGPSERVAAQSGVGVWIMATTATLFLASVVTPIALTFRAITPEQRAVNVFVLQNVFFTATWGTVLLLLNWATS